MSVCPELFHLFCQISRRYPQRICLACGIDISQHQMVGMGERLGKFVEESLGTSVSMGLEYTSYFVVREVLCRFERGGNLCGVVGVIIDNGYTVKLALIFKPPVRAAKGEQSFPGCIHRDPEQICYGDGGKRIRDIVVSGDGQLYTIRAHAVFDQIKRDMSFFIISDIIVTVIKAGG